MSEAATATHYVRPDSILRYTFQERVMHWATALAYSYCLATGLAFYTPYLFWIAVVLGGGPTSRFWHPIVGLGLWRLLCGCISSGAVTCSGPKRTSDS